MKKLKRLKKISELIDESYSEIKKELDKLNKDYKKKIIEANLNLLSEIAKGENLDELELKEKYCNIIFQKQILTKKSEKIEQSNLSEDSEEILSHVSIDGNDYYFEDKNNGNVYDKKSKKVGIYNCGQIAFTSNK